MAITPEENPMTPKVVPIIMKASQKPTSPPPPPPSKPVQKIPVTPAPTVPSIPKKVPSPIPSTQTSSKYQPTIINIPPPPPTPSRPAVTERPVAIPVSYLPPASTYLPPYTTPSSIPGKFITKAIVIPPVVKPSPPPIVQKPSTPVVIRAPPPPPQQPAVPKTPTPFVPRPPSEPEISVKSNCEIYGNCESQSIVINTPTPPVTDTCDQCCSADESAQITIPIKLSSAGKNGACASYAKLIIPASSISAETLTKLISNPSDVAKNVLKSLA